jgi:DNA replication protein DnaC
MSHSGRIFVTSDDVKRLKDQIIGKFCGGKCEKRDGAVLVNRVFQDCECLIEFRKQHRFMCAGIPKKYWDFTLDDLLPTFHSSNEVALQLVQRYVEKVGEMIDSGVGLYIQGKSGLAKSAIASYILKEAQLKDYECYCIRMSQLTKTIFESLDEYDKRDLLKWIKDSVQLLLIDEVDKDYKVQNVEGFAGNQINEFFGDIYNSRKALIVTSNLSKQDLSKVHALNVVDRLSELADIVLVGESYRKPDAAFEKILGETNGKEKS